MSLACGAAAEQGHCREIRGLLHQFFLPLNSHRGTPPDSYNFVGNPLPGYPGNTPAILVVDCPRGAFLYGCSVNVIAWLKWGNLPFDENTQIRFWKLTSGMARLLME